MYEAAVSERDGRGVLATRKTAGQKASQPKWEAGN